MFSFDVIQYITQSECIQHMQLTTDTGHASMRKLKQRCEFSSFKTKQFRQINFQKRFYVSSSCVLAMLGLDKSRYQDKFDTIFLYLLFSFHRYNTPWLNKKVQNLCKSRYLFNVAQLKESLLFNEQHTYKMKTSINENIHYTLPKILA